MIDVAVQRWMLHTSPKRIKQDEEDFRAKTDVINENFISPFEEQELLRLLIQYCFTNVEKSQ